MGTCRILICGNTGVGKSTLLNRVFDIPMVISETPMVSILAKLGTLGRRLSGSSHTSVRVQRIQVTEANMISTRRLSQSTIPASSSTILKGSRPGNDKGVAAFMKFLKRRSGSAEMREQLHAIWYDSGPRKLPCQT